MSHYENIIKLQKDKTWLVNTTPGKIRLTRRFGSKVITIDLSRVKEGYVIDPLSYQFQATNSHFDYHHSEFRWSRNKIMFKSLIKTLKRTNVWDSIVNRNEFLKINSKNKRATKKNVLIELADLIN